MEAPTKWWNFKFSGRVEITPENLQIGTAFYNKTRSKNTSLLTITLNLQMDGEVC